MNGCLDDWMACLVADLKRIVALTVEAFGHLWCLLQGPVARLGQPGYPNELFGIPVQAGATIYGDLLDSGLEGLAACGTLWRRVAAE